MASVYILILSNVIVIIIIMFIATDMSSGNVDI